MFNKIGFSVFVFFMVINVFFLLGQTGEKFLSGEELDAYVEECIINSTFEKAIPHLKNQLAVLVSADNVATKEELDSLRLSYLQDLVVVHFFSDDYKSAEEYLRERNKLLLELSLEKTEDYFLGLADLAIALDRQGKYRSAESIYLEAIGLGNEMFGKEDISSLEIRSQLAVMYSNAGRYEDAKTIYLQLLALLEDEPEFYSEVKHNLATIYSDLRQYKEADEIYLELLKRDAEIFGKKNTGYVILLSNLGKLYEVTSRNKEAKDVLSEALDILRKINGHSLGLYKSNVLQTLAMIDKKEGKYLEAIAKNKEAFQLEVDALGLQHHRVAHNYLQLATIKIDMGKYEEAYQYCLKSFWANLITTTAEEKVDVLQIKIEDCANYMQLLASMKQTLIALEALYHKNKDKATLQLYSDYALVAIELQKEIRTIRSRKDKLVLGELQSFFVQAALKANQLLSSANYEAVAFKLAEQNKSILLTDALQDEAAYSWGELPDSIQQLQEQYQNYIVDLKSQLLQTANKREQEEISKSISDWTLNLKILQQNIKEKYPKYYEHRYQVKTINIAEIQQEIPTGALLLEYYITPDLIYLFAVSSSEVKSYTLNVSPQELQKEAKNFHQLLSDYKQFKNTAAAYENYTKMGYWFYATILKIALQDFPTHKQLIIVPDGELNYLPFEAFLTEKVTDEQSYATMPYLLKDYTVSYSYSAALWQQYQTNPPKQHNHKVLAMAGDYGGKTEDQDSTRRRTNELAIRGNLGAIKGTPLEIQGISKIFAGDYYYKQDANERNFKALAADYGILHLAAHGFNNHEKPLLSSIVLTENNDSLENNFLQAYEISQLHLNADLVVLSACETGYGKFEQGEGVMSLARSFMYAGAPSVVMSLWQVNDQATAIIMQSFYEHLAAGVTKSEALRQAKLEYLAMTEGLAGHPAFWSAFVQLGATSPVRIQTKTNWQWIGIGVGLVVMLLGGVGIYRQRKRAA